MQIIAIVSLPLHKITPNGKTPLGVSLISEHHVESDLNFFEEVLGVYFLFVLECRQ